MSQKLTPILILLAATQLASVATAQELVVNGSFESPSVAGAWVQRAPGTTFGGWSVDNIGQGVVHVASYGSPLTPFGLQSVELNFFVQGGISQTLATLPGRDYTLSFELAGQNNAGPDVKQMRIDWGGSPLATVSWAISTSHGLWEHHEFVVRATDPSTVLHFFGLTNVDGGPYIDNVSVTPLCPSDFNLDGGVDGSDVNAFFDAWESGDMSADLNADGGVDGGDVEVFFEHWEAGC